MGAAAPTGDPSRRAWSPAPACGSSYPWTAARGSVVRRHPAARAAARGARGAGYRPVMRVVDGPRATLAPAPHHRDRTGAVVRGGSAGDRRRRRRCRDQQHHRRILRGVLHGQLGSRGHEHRSPTARPAPATCRPASRPLPTGRTSTASDAGSVMGPSPWAPWRQMTSDHRCSVSKRVSCRGSSSEKCTRSRRSRGFIAPQGSGRGRVGAFGRRALD